MKFRFLPKGFDFFTLFDKQANCAVDAAKLFTELVLSGVFDSESVQRMREIEHQADEVTHDIMKNLNLTFITPFDREDIHALASEMDSVIDMMYTIVNRMSVYKISGVDQDLVQFSNVIERSVITLASAVKSLNNTKNYESTIEACIEVNRLENIGDTMRDTIIGKLFETSTDTIFIVKWKEIYQFAESVLDICEDVANVVESIVVKQA
jgi:predicted phosphate transport protein (TIGR00153 family)